MLKDDLENPAYLTKARHSQLIDNLARCDYHRWLVYCGLGECTMHPDLVEFVAEAKKALSPILICIVTNGDLLTADLLSRLSGVDLIWWSCYDNGPTARKMGDIVRESGYPPMQFYVKDLVDRPREEWSSRAGTIFKAPGAAKARHLPCGKPVRWLSLMACGQFGVCCADPHRRIAWDCSLPELVKDQSYLKLQTDLLAGNREPYPPCCECEIAGVPRLWPKDMNRPYAWCAPAIPQTRFWNMQ